MKEHIDGRLFHWMDNLVLHINYDSMGIFEYDIIATVFLTSDPNRFENYKIWNGYLFFITYFTIDCFYFFIVLIFNKWLNVATETILLFWYYKILIVKCIIIKVIKWAKITPMILFYKQRMDVRFPCGTLIIILRGSFACLFKK